MNQNRSEQWDGIHRMSWEGEIASICYLFDKVYDDFYKQLEILRAIKEVTELRMN